MELRRLRHRRRGRIARLVGDEQWNATGETLNQRHGDTHQGPTFVGVVQKKTSERVIRSERSRSVQHAIRQLKDVSEQRSRVLSLGDTKEKKEKGQEHAKTRERGHER